MHGSVCDWSCLDQNSVVVNVYRLIVCYLTYGNTDADLLYDREIYWVHIRNV